MTGPERLDAFDVVPPDQPAGRDEIAKAAGVDLDPARPDEPLPGKLDPSARPRSVLQAQALALRAQLIASAKIASLLTERRDLTGECKVMIEVLGIQFEAGIVQCDSFLVMAEAMSATLPRPAAPQQPSAPKVFGGAKTS